MRMGYRLFATTSWLAMSAGAYAHHGWAPHFDGNDVVSIEGRVTKFEFVNPHSFVYVDVTNDAGEVVTHWCEMQARSQLQRRGIGEAQFKIGSTIAIQGLFRPMIWVVKRELTWIPFIGWALKAVHAIALNRGTGRKAINQLIEESQIHMDKGRILMLFPEGTRVLPKQKKPFKIGGAIVSQRTGYSVLPIAHNAGEFWPRHSWIKWPGTIRVVIGKPIDPEGKKPEDIINEVSNWILNECERISDEAQLHRIGVL